MKSQNLLLIAVLALPSCASLAPAPINLAPTPETMNERAPEDFGIDGDALALAFSGGGARAAAFSYGVLDGLRTMPSAEGGALIDQVAFVSAVSGGSVTAAYFGLHGADMDGFLDAYLYKSSDGALDTSPVSPANWLRAAQGGVNDSRRLGDWLDAEIYHGATLRDLWAPGRPRVWLNAADLYNGTQFAFAQPYFDAVCTPLAPLRVADAVAASMAVPIGFRPVVLEAFPDACAPLPAWVAETAADRHAPQLLRSTARALLSYRDPAQLRFVHLMDGGIVDNLGLTSLLTMRHAAGTPYGPLSPRDAVRMRRLTFLVVNAEVVENHPWSQTAAGPDGADAASATINSLMNSGKRGAYDAMAIMLEDWETDIRTYRCGLPESEVLRLRGSLEHWNCQDVHFTLDMISFRDLPDADRDHLGAMATVVSLDRESIDALIAGGRAAVLQNEAALALTQ